MDASRTRLAAAVTALRTVDDVVALLHEFGRYAVAVDTAQLRSKLPWAPGDTEQLWFLNPGEDAPLWVARSRASDATLDRGLRLSARSSVGGAATLIVLGEDAPELRVAVADDRVVERCRWSSRQQERALDAWSAIVGVADSVIGALRAHRLLRKRTVGARFFADVKRALGTVRDAWSDGPPDAADRHALAMTFFCRMMFLYFVQRRGWLDGDEGYMAALTLDPDHSDVYATRLRPLFFEVLSRPADQRPGAWSRARVPYLNGGLFEPSGLERAHPNASLPDPVVRGVVRGVLERYRFVGREDEDRVGIDPVMLGTVFESLMSPDLRASSGAFYTPPALVRRVVRDALGQLLHVKLGPGWERTLDGAPPPDEPASARDLLDPLTVLDPAMGSGAFLLGALHALVPLRQRLFAEDRYTATRHVIAHNLFGVDLSATATTIAGLRLWLALAAATPADVDDVPPLPNLSHRLRRGNALFGPTVLAQLDGVTVPPDVARRLRDASERFAFAHGPDKVDASRALREAERDAAVAALDAASARVRTERQQITGRTAPDLLGHTRSLSLTERRAAQRLEQRALELGQTRQALARGEWTPAFDLHLHFADPIARGGFDLLVGNPPWVRMSNLDAAERRRLKGVYQWVANAGRGRAFGSQADLSVAFVERGVRLLREDGVLAMVVPSKLLSAGYGAALRRGAERVAPPVRIRDLSEDPVSHFDADVFPATIVLQRRAHPERDVMLHVNGRASACPRALLALTPHPDAPWSMLGANGVRAYRQLVASAPTLGQRMPVRLGVKTGANNVFIGLDDPFDEQVPVVRGADVTPMRAQPSTTLLFPHEPVTGAPLTEEALSPAARAWFANNRARLERRSDLGGSDPLWRVFRCPPDALGHRVVWRDIGMRLDAAYVPPVAVGGPVVLNTAYLVPVRDADQGKRLAAWLCASPIGFVAAAGAERALSGYRRFMARNVASVPVPDSVIDGDEELDRIARALDDAPGDGSLWAALDALVGRRLGLSPATLAYIQSVGDKLSLRSADLSAIVRAVAS